MMKNCVDCGQTGHTSEGCKNGKVGSFNLFGVRIDPTADADQSEGDDDHLQGCSSNREMKSLEVLKIENNEHSNAIDVTDDQHDHDKKKGVPWTEDEHRSFLAGLEKLGKGHWRAISKHYVPTRTPTQVASHAQKYFIRMNSPEEKRKRKASLFDMPVNELSVEASTSARPLVAPLARTNSVEGYNQFANLMDYCNNYIPTMNYPFQEKVYPINPCIENFVAFLSPLQPQPPPPPPPLPLTNTNMGSTEEPQVETSLTNTEKGSTEEPQVETSPTNTEKRSTKDPQVETTKD